MFQELKQNLVNENPDIMNGTILKFIVYEEYLILKYLQRYLSQSIKDKIKEKFNSKKLKILQSKKDCIYNTNQAFN